MGIWYDDGETIPYLTRFHARQAQPLERADLARWMNSPEVRAW